MVCEVSLSHCDSSLTHIKRNITGKTNILCYTLHNAWAGGAWYRIKELCVMLRPLRSCARHNTVYPFCITKLQSCSCCKSRVPKFLVAFLHKSTSYRLKITCILCSRGKLCIYNFKYPSIICLWTIILAKDGNQNAKYKCLCQWRLGWDPLPDTYLSRLYLRGEIFCDFL